MLHLHDGNIFGETAFLIYDENFVRYLILCEEYLISCEILLPCSRV